MARTDRLPLPATLLRRVAALGVDVATTFADAGIEGDPGAGAYVTTAQFLRFWRAVESSGAPRDAGLRLGGERSPEELTVASMAALHAATLGDGLARLARYKRLVCPEEIAIDVARGEARVRFEWLLAEEAPCPILVDTVFAGILALARQGTGTQLVPRRIELARRKRDAAMLRAHFACEVTFDEPVDLIAFDANALALPFVTQDPRWGGKILALLEQTRKEHSVADALRTALGRTIGERPSVGRVAKTLGMSGRTLQRRLEALGTSYQAVLDDVRRRSARRLLADTDLESAEVAFLLGFEEQSSFTRAFHGWEGTSPIRWRATERNSS